MFLCGSQLEISLARHTYRTSHEPLSKITRESLNIRIIHRFLSGSRDFTGTDKGKITLDSAANLPRGNTQSNNIGNSVRRTCSRFQQPNMNRER